MWHSEPSSINCGPHSHFSLYLRPVVHFFLLLWALSEFEFETSALMHLRIFFDYIFLFNERDIIIKLINERIFNGYLAISLIRNPSYLNLFPSHFLSSRFRRFFNFWQSSSFCVFFHNFTTRILRRRLNCFSTSADDFQNFAISLSLSSLLSLFLSLSLVFSLSLFLSLFISLRRVFFMFKERSDAAAAECAFVYQNYVSNVH